MLENMRALFGANVRHARLKAKLTQVQVQELTQTLVKVQRKLRSFWEPP
jgi:hypothetical protein